MEVFRIIAVDPTLSRFDPFTVLQNILMELLVQDIGNIGIITEDPPRDIREWKNVELDALGNVTWINWSNLDTKGSIDFKYLPPTVENINLDARL